MSHEGPLPFNWVAFLDSETNKLHVIRSNKPEPRQFKVALLDTAAWTAAPPRPHRMGGTRWRRWGTLVIRRWKRRRWTGIPPVGWPHHRNQHGIVLVWRRRRIRMSIPLRERRCNPRQVPVGGAADRKGQEVEEEVVVVDADGPFWWCMIAKWDWNGRERERLSYVWTIWLAHASLYTIWNLVIVI